MYLYLQIPELWAGYQWTLRVAAESQRKNKAIVTTQLGKVLPRMLSLLSYIPCVAEVSLDAVKLENFWEIGLCKKRVSTVSESVASGSPR